MRRSACGPDDDSRAAQLINRLGRRLLTVASFAICGAACVAVAVLPADGDAPIPELRIASAVLGKFGGASAFILLFVYTTELFPTAVRNAALGANSAAARVGGVIAPLVVLVATAINASMLSFAIFGLTSFIAGALGLCFAHIWLMSASAHFCAPARDAWRQHWSFG